MAEALIAPFVMHGARDAIAGGLVHIEEQVKAIERAVVENPGLAFDLARTLVESVCRAVLRERAVAYSEDDDLPKLFKTVAHPCLSCRPQRAGKRKPGRASRRPSTA